jgi:hypothetical protein
MPIYELGESPKADAAPSGGCGAPACGTGGCATTAHTG